MIRGTTPILHFTLPFNVSELSEYWITISQRYENIKIDKTSEDCTASGKEITLMLSQEDTLKLIPNKPAYIQIRALTDDDDYAIASNIIKCSVDDILKEGVIGDE